MANRLVAFKQRRLYHAYERGLPAAQGAKLAQVATTTAESYYTRFREGYTPEQIIVQSVYRSLDDHVKWRWRREARRRDIPLRHLIRQVANDVAIHDLFEAILGKTKQ